MFLDMSFIFFSVTFYKNFIVDTRRALYLSCRFPSIFHNGPLALPLY